MFGKSLPAGSTGFAVTNNLFSSILFFQTHFVIRASEHTPTFYITVAGKELCLPIPPEGLPETRDAEHLRSPFIYILLNQEVIENPAIRIAVEREIETRAHSNPDEVTMLKLFVKGMLHSE